MPLSIVSFLPRIASRDSQLGVSSETKDAANPSAKQGGLSAAKSSPRTNWILDLLKGGQHQGQGEQLLRYKGGEGFIPHLSKSCKSRFPI